MSGTVLEGVVIDIGAGAVTVLDAAGQRVSVPVASHRALYGLRPFGACVELELDNNEVVRWRPSYPVAKLARLALEHGGGATPAEAKSIVAHFPGMLRDVFMGDLDMVRDILDVAERNDTEDAAWRERLGRILSAYVYAVGPVFAALLVQEARMVVDVDLDWGLAVQINDAFDRGEPTVPPRDRLERFRGNPWLPYLYGLAPSDPNDRKALKAVIRQLALAYQAAGGLPNFDEDERVGIFASHLSRHMNQGHSYSAQAVLYTARELKCPVRDIYTAINNSDQFTKTNDLPDLEGGAVVYGTVTGFKWLYFAENNAAVMIGTRAGDVVRPLPLKAGLSGEQKAAADTIAREALTVLSGPAGSGKTFTLATVAKAAARAGARVALLATTGVAAQRLANAAGMPGRTLHSFIGMVPGVSRLHPPADSLEPVDLMIIDESSMMDSVTLGKLAAFFRFHNDQVTHLVLAGDGQQLPPVGSGKPFADLLNLLDPNNIALLTQVRRAKAQGLVHYARSIAQGGPVSAATQYGSEISAHDVVTTSDVWAVVLQVARDIDVDPKQVGVVAPRYDGLLGVNALNKMLRQHLNPGAQGAFWPGDRVVQCQNRTLQVAGGGTANVWNGTIGEVRYVSPQNGFLEVDMDGSRVVYSPDLALHDLKQGWALTVHKSQGGQFPGVVFAFEPDALHGRELAYTAVTRAEERLAVVSTPGGVAQAGSLKPETPLRFGFFAPLLVNNLANLLVIP